MIVKELWALCYLHDWDPVDEDGVQPVYPEIHRVYLTWEEAERSRKSKIRPERYHVRRANLGSFSDGVDSFTTFTITT